MTKTLIIAEAGVNHNGDLDLAFQLVDAAAHAGADVVKFQTFQALEMTTKYANKADYQKLSTDKHECQLDMLKALELSHDQHIELSQYCNSLGIEFLSSAFDLTSIDRLIPLNLLRWKIPSGEITNLPYLSKIGSFAMPVILSTGMANMGDIEAALNVLESVGTSRDLVTVLHCTTEYPAPLDDVNLLAMRSISQAFGVSVGYSDHTDGIAVSTAAVALGASIIEKHLTLDRSMVGPDHSASLEPHQFASMVDSIRSIERALGDGIKRPTVSENRNSYIARKSLVASTTILKGEQFTLENITVKRPGYGISL